MNICSDGLARYVSLSLTNWRSILLENKYQYIKKDPFYCKEPAALMTWLYILRALSFLKELAGVHLSLDRQGPSFKCNEPAALNIWRYAFRFLFLGRIGGISLDPGHYRDGPPFEGHSGPGRSVGPRCMCMFM